jgi:hypothetical protein
MALIAKESEEKSFSPVPEGVHVAVCYSLIDLGVHHNKTYDKKQHKIMLTWELPDERIETEEGLKPRVISQQYTNTLSEKATLRQHLEAWRGRVFTEEERKGFLVEKVLKTGCQLQIIHEEKNGKVYANIKSIMSLPKGVKAPALENAVINFDMEDGNLERINAEMGKLHEWQQKIIKDSLTYKELLNTPNEPEEAYAR